jgi:hypothetical protein
VEQYNRMQKTKILNISAKTAGKSALLDSVRDAIRVRHYSLRTVHTYVDWIYRYSLKDNIQYPTRNIQ